MNKAFNRPHPLDVDVLRMLVNYVHRMLGFKPISPVLKWGPLRNPTEMNLSNGPQHRTGRNA